MLSMHGFSVWADSSGTLSVLRPQQNNFRQAIDLSGVWQFRVDSLQQGEAQGWAKGLSQTQPIAVPGSWNDQIDGLHNYLGHAWYETTCFVPEAWQSERVMLRFGSATYAAKVWVNGTYVGGHEGGSLPFALDLSGAARYGQDNKIVVEVDNELSPSRVPTGMVEGKMRNYPYTNYDFFPFSGLHRAVTLYTVPRRASIEDVAITTEQAVEGAVGRLNVKVRKLGDASGARLTVSDATGVVAKGLVSFASAEASASIAIPRVKLWSPESPYLYKVKVELMKGNRVVDAYTCRTGVRTIAVEGDRLLLNGQPLRLRGFGMHEDFPVYGRGATPPVWVKNLGLLKWVGANCFRTSHYPYDESVYDMADELGLLIIDETPAVGLYFDGDPEALVERKATALRYVDEMIERDRNHPSVIMWSVANEPQHKAMGGANYNGKEQRAAEDENRNAIDCLGALIAQAHKKDSSRPATFAGIAGGPHEWLALADVVCVNRYYGWYTNPGDMTAAIKILSNELDEIHRKTQKPIMLTEFGADATAGFHSLYNDMFSEEFQWDFLRHYLDLANTKPYVQGMLIWNFCDFKTGQAMFRANSMNLKGVFTADRQPKLSATMLHERWTGGNIFF